ncbi:PKHS1 protein, partial [Anseranas semipalmata]|nr:PKHS1 protein [Anseranas semipalmata]
QSSFCREGGVCKHGFLIKSPPPQLFSSQNSWKRRFFILSKSKKGNYILKYLKGQSMKGSIAVDQIVKVEIGISNSETMAMVKKMFRCFPEEVMSITTGSRCYYLIGKSRQEIEDWVTAISSIREAKKDGCCPQVTSAKEVLVFCSHKVVCKALMEEAECRRSQHFLFCVQDDGPSDDKNRPNSDPGPHQVQNDSPRGNFPSPDKNLGKSDENLLSSDSDEDIKKEEEAYYQTPSNLLAQVIYQLLDESCQLTCRHDRLPTPPKRRENSARPRDLEANRDLKLPESSTTQQSTLQRRQNSSPLSVIQLSVLLSQVTDETQLQELDIFIPLADINSYLKLTEAAGQI